MAIKPTCLIVDDENDLSELLSITLEKMGIHTECAETVENAKSLLARHNYDLCLTDMRLPDGNGLDLVKHIGLHHTGLPVAVITAYGSPDNAVSALKAGAFDYISKPISLQQLRPLVISAIKVSQVEAARNEKNSLIGSSAAITEVRHLIDKVSLSQTPVLITGESGTGKTSAAKLIHLNSPRREQAFIKVNCGSLTERNAEADLFGCIKNGEEKTGLIKAADGGTLFLDNVDELPLSIQNKLLEVIQEKSICVLGAKNPEFVDIRLISSSRKDLKTMANQNTFRQDFYYRINVIELAMPALRNISKDISAIAQHLLEKIAGAYQINTPRLSDCAIEKLKNHYYDGNVRELHNLLERAFSLSDKQTIQAEDLRIKHVTLLTNSNVITSDMALPDYLDHVEKQAIIEALNKTRQNKTAAAKLLGVSFRTLRYRLSKLGLNNQGMLS